jgi:FdhE protein
MPQLRGHLDRRIGDLMASHPELERALTLQHTLLSRQVELLEVIKTGGLPGLALPIGYVAAKLTRGIPVLHAEPIPLPAHIFALTMREFTEHLARGGAGEAAAGLGRALDSHALDPASLLSACFGRDQRRVRFMASQAAVSPDLSWLVAELALAPFAYLLQCRALQSDRTVIAAAVGAWDRGFCPACGSWPAMIEGAPAASAHGRHVLLCSFCAARWQLSSYRCMYCGNDKESFVTAAPDPEQPGRRVQLCGECGGYAKVLDLSEPIEFPLAAVEDLASMDLDMIAIERKYLKPPLPDIKRKSG